MSSLNLYDLRQSLNAENILICFNGPLSRSIIEEIGEAIRSYLRTLEGSENRGRVKDVFSVFVEQTQNIRHYLADLGEDPDAESRLAEATVVIARAGEDYIVASGNLVRKNDIPGLQAHLEHLDSLDAQGLKQLYKSVLRTPRDPDASGAGLGLIDMARRARAPLDWDTVSVDDAHVFFSLRVTV